jgi:acyl-CoA synthetase (NDP forming)
MAAIGSRQDIDTIGVYVEGFQDLDGLAFTRAVEESCQEGKTVVFYKAGKTPAGRSASAGHTASVAGDYEVCQAVVAHAGAIVVDTFKEFEQVIELATLFHDKAIGGRRLAVLSNAGFEAVGMADAIQGLRYELQMADLAEQTRERLAQAIHQGGLGALVTPSNPLDLNPMADESLYEECVRAMMEDPNVDAVVASIVPFTPRLRTTDQELLDDPADSIADRMTRIQHEYTKPLVVVIHAREPYTVLAKSLRHGGVPVFPACDQAIRSLGRYLCQRIAQNRATNPRDIAGYAAVGVS